MPPGRLRTALVRLATLVVIVFAGDRVLALGFGKLVLSSQARYSVLYRGGAPADVVVVGDSRGVNGFFAPSLEKELGVRVENLSFSGLSVVLSEAIVRDWVDHHGKPRTLVVEVSNVGRINDGIEGLVPFWAYSERLRAIARKEASRTWEVIRMSHLYAFNGEQFVRTMYYLRRSDQDWINRYRISPSLVEQTRGMAPFEMTSREDQLESLARLVAFGREQGIDVRLVVAPHLCEYLDHASNYEAWLDQIESAAGERVWDAGCSDHDVTHFADRVHLNAEGAEAFDASLVREGMFDAGRAAPPRSPRQPER